jgi:hypothetical protein
MPCGGGYPASLLNESRQWSDMDQAGVEEEAAARAILDHNASALLGIGHERQGTPSSPVRTR